MPTPELRFTILDDPGKRLQSLKRATRNVILRKAVRAGSKSVREAAKRHAPRDRGILAGSITVRIGTNRKTGAIYAVIGPRRGIVSRKRRGQVVAARPSKIAHLVMWGTEAHSLVKGDKLARRTQAGKQTDSPRFHPGAKANEFLQRAYRVTASYSAEDMRRVIEEETRKRLAKAKRKK